MPYLARFRCLGWILLLTFNVPARGQRFDCGEENCVYRPLFKTRAVVHGHDSDPFWQRVGATMIQTGKDMNIDLTLQYHSSPAYDGEAMADQISAAATTTPPPDALILTIPDNVVQEAVGAVIGNTTVPVFGLNTGADVQTLATKGFVALDDRLAGRAAGETFFKLLTATERSASAPSALFINHACTCISVSMNEVNPLD
jgi:ABC-type sugar transport system substrate-binding protein